MEHKKTLNYRKDHSDQHICILQDKLLRNRSPAITTFPIPNQSTVTTIYLGDKIPSDQTRKMLWQEEYGWNGPDQCGIPKPETVFKIIDQDHHGRQLSTIMGKHL